MKKKYIFRLERCNFLECNEKKRKKKSKFWEIYENLKKNLSYVFLL